MDPVQKALWFVETHWREALSLEAIAQACYVSPFHLTRAFAAAMGLSLMRYVRGRRLTEAARQLAQGAPDILALALDAGYNSHEAFTRAFRDQFGITPEQVRAQGHLDQLKLVEPITMSTESIPEIEAPRYENRPAIRFAGFVERYDCQSPSGIPDQWQRFAPHLGRIPGQMGDAAYGVCFHFDAEGNFDYMCGVEIAGRPELPPGFATLDVAAAKYAVFVHRGHIAGIRSTLLAIWRHWIPKSDLKPAAAPTFERYGREFNPQTGLGGVEIWIPIEA